MICPYCAEDVPADSVQHQGCKGGSDKPFPTLYLDNHSGESRAEPVVVSVIGFSGHGKTVFLCALFDYIDDHLTYIWRNNFHNLALDQDSLTQVNFNRNRLRQGKLPFKTDVDFPRPGIFRLKHMPRSSGDIALPPLVDTTILIYDPPGEAFRTDDKIADYASFVKRSNCVLFLIDLTALDTSIAHEMGRLLETYVLGMVKLKIRQQSQHLIVVYTKSDAMKVSVPEFKSLLEREPWLRDYLEVQRPETLADPSEHFRQMEKVSNVLAEFTWSDLKAANFVAIADDWFASVSYTVVSSLGSAPVEFQKANGQNENGTEAKPQEDGSESSTGNEAKRLTSRMSPRGIADPLLYVLAKSLRWQPVSRIPSPVPPSNSKGWLKDLLVKFWSTIILVFILIAAVHFSPVARSQETKSTQRRSRVDWIFVLDTSASMRGAGGTSNIFDRVKTALETFINNTEEGDSVTVYTFDRDTMLRPTVRIVNDADRRDLLNTIGSLEANGDRTHTGKAVRDALDRARELKEAGESQHRTPSIVLLTDGIEDVRGIPNPVSIRSNLERLSQIQPYLFYVSLGEEHDPQLDSLVRDPVLLDGKGLVIRDANAVGIRNLIEILRKPVEEAVVLPSPSPTPVQVNIQVEPINLNFGEIKPGSQTRRETIKLTSNTDVVVQLALDGQSGMNLVEPSDPIALKAGQPGSVDVRLASTSDAKDGQRTFLLKTNVRNDMASLPADAVVKPGSVECHIAVMHASLLRTLLPWLAIIPAIVLCVLIASCIYTGRTPRGLIALIYERHMLEGELQVLRPKPSQPEQAFVNLTGLNTRRFVLSQVVPGSAARDADAELATARANGSKLIRLRRTNGNVRVNGIEVSFADLYDGDMIDLGDARLRFNSLDRRRPDENGDAFN